MPFDAEPTVEVTTRDRMIRLRDFLAILPEERFNMSSTSVPDGPFDCGTPACIAGWAHALFKLKPGLEYYRDVGRHLGLSRGDATDLFAAAQFPVVPRSTAQAVEVIDHYLATGKIDWSVA